VRPPPTSQASEGEVDSDPKGRETEGASNIKTRPEHLCVLKPPSIRLRRTAPPQAVFSRDLNPTHRGCACSNGSVPPQGGIDIERPVRKHRNHNVRSFYVERFLRRSEAQAEVGEAKPTGTAG